MGNLALKYALISIIICKSKKINIDILVKISICISAIFTLDFMHKQYK